MDLTFPRSDPRLRPLPAGDAMPGTEALLQGALRAMTDAVVVVDTRGVVVFLNPTATHLTGWRESDSVGRPLAEVVRFADAHGRAVDVLPAGEGRIADVSLLLRRDGHAVLVDGDTAPVPDALGRELGTVVTFRNITAAKRLTDELTWQATHDPLTGLANRRAFDSRLKRAVAAAGEQGCRHALLYLDLDRFKDVNDAGGHVAGDELLRQLAAMLRRHLRERDMLSRLGGDEFVVLLEDCTAEQAARVAEKLRAAVSGFAFGWQGLDFAIGTSIGLVTFCDAHRSAAELLRRADALCYRAKSHGRDQVVADLNS
jgi:diguanylate cyclase (GGDEF)-like protein/PAS domain S-box-containing protein